MVYMLDLSADELKMLKDLLTLFPNLQGTTPEQRTTARNLLNYITGAEVAKPVEPPADCDEAEANK